jgi:hypothetical protein
MNTPFAPGKKGNLRIIMKRTYLNQFNEDTTSKCACLPEAILKKHSQPENMRISRSVSETLGGKIMYGNSYTPAVLNFLGGWEGQSGGLPRPLRNKF